MECKPSTPTPWLWYQYASHSGNVGGTDLVDASNPAGASEARAWDLYTQDLGRNYTLCQGPTVTFSNDWHTVYPTASKPDTNLLRDFTVSYGTPGYNPQGQLFCMPQSSTGRLQRGRQLRCSGPGVWSGPYGSSDNVMRCVCNDISCQPLVDQSCAAGNPILPGSGVKVAREDDYLGAGTHPLSARRFYRSRMTAATSAGWMSEWARRLDLGRAGDPQAGVTAVREDGRIETYALSAGIWAPYSGAQGSLETVRDASGAITAWQLVRKDDDSVETFDTAGRLLAVQARNGWTTTLSYSTSVTPPAVAPSIGLLIGVKNHFGRELRFTYDSQGRMRELLPPGAISGSAAGSAQSPIVYRYEELASLGSQTPVAGQLTSVTWQDGHVKRYHYEDARFPNNLTGITDELGVRIGTYAYNAANQAISTQGANGADRLEFQYSGSSNTLVTDYGGGSAVQRGYGFTVSNGVIRPSYVTSPCPLCGNTQASTSYDATGNTAKTIGHDGQVSFYAYDVRGRETERATFPSSYQSAATRPALSAATRVTSTQWHATWKLPLQVAEPGKLSSYSYDARGNLTGQSWTATTDATGAQGFGATATGATYATGWAYDGNSLPVSIVEQTGTTETGRWTLAYNGSGDVTSVTDVIRGNLVGRATQYDAHGRMLAGTTDAGVALGFTYAPRGFYATKRVSGQTVTFTQNPIGLTTEVRMPDSQVLGYVYDAAHRLTDIRLNGASITPAMLASAEYPDTFAKATFERTRVLLQGAIEALLPSAFAQVPMPPGGLRPVLILPGQPMPGQPEFDPRTDLMTMAPMLPVDRAQRAIAEALQRCVSCNPNGGYERPWLTPGSYAHLMTGGHLFPMFGNQSYFTIPVGQSLVDTVVAAGQPTTEKGKLVYRVVLPGYVGRIPWPFGSGTFAETKKITLVVEKENCPPGQYARNEVVTMHPGWRRIDGP